MRAVTVIAAATLLVCAWAAAYAQDAVPGEILLRTVFIKQKRSNEAGSAFTLDYKGKLYLVTARHVIEGVANSDAIIEVRRSERWEDYHTVKTLCPASADVDIAVFETDETATKPFEIAPMGTPTTAGITFGQQVWFIGYPFGMSSVLGKGSAITAPPFMKRGSMSAVDAANPDAIVFYIDGFNNPGFPEDLLFIGNSLPTNIKFWAWLKDTETIRLRW